MIPISNIEIDPSRFNDPVAMQTEWKPCNSSGSNFCTEKLVNIDSNRIEFRSTIGVWGLYWVCILAGAVILYFSITRYISVWPVLIGIIFILFGGLFLLFGTKPIVFDKSVGLSYKGRRLPDQKSEQKGLTELDAVHAIQLITKIVRGKKAFYCYELNFVLHDGQRVNLFSHSNQKRLLSDARSLSEFLEKPVWDTTGDQ